MWNPIRPHKPLKVTTIDQIRVKNYSYLLQVTGLTYSISEIINKEIIKNGEEN